jgi:hypothetical protein
MLTISIDPNGFGCMYQSIMCCLAYCRKNNIEYLHTSLTSVHHGAKAKECNDLIGMHIYAKASFSTPKLDYSPDIWGGPPDELFSEDVLKEIRTNYRGKKETNNIICIHLRRGDVDSINHPERYDSDEKYLPVIDYLKKEYQLPVVICTQESRDKLSTILKVYPDIEVNNYDTPLKTFEFMACAKVLFIARSSYSYVAGILNENHIYYNAIDKRYHHQAFNRWKMIPDVKF